MSDQVDEREWATIELGRAIDDCLQRGIDLPSGMFIPEKEWRMLLMAARGLKDAMRSQ